jgi:hypothetical protein
LIFKLKDQITEIKILIVLLDNHALILEKSLEQQAENRIIAASIGLAIVIVIGLLFFFFQVVVVLGVLASPVTLSPREVVKVLFRDHLQVLI